MLLDPRVIGRGLEGDVERNLDPAPARVVDEARERGQVAELRMNGRVAACRAADCPRHARIARALRRLVVRPLAELAADGMDRWQVQDVEAELGDVVEAV